jgi:transposase-like protein
MFSVTKLEKCLNCLSENIVKNGFTKGGNQRVHCHDCSKNRVLRRKFDHDFDVHSIRRSFLERMSLCGVCRVFLISYY